MKETSVENLIIGFGKAGKTLAADLAKNGRKVILIEKDDKMFGGTCINVGCIPSKRLIFEGEHFAGNTFEKVMADKDSLIGALRNANFNKLDSLDNVEVIVGTAKFVDNNTVEIPEQNHRVKAERIFINTGTSSRKLNTPGIDGKYIYDSTGFLNLKSRPDKVVIVGAGYISLEFAFMYAAFGSQITILDRGDVFLPREDRDIAEEMLRILKSKGVEVVLDVEVNRYETVEPKVKVVTSKGDFEADAVLVAVGRVPNTKELGLENTEVKLDERGYIVTDEYLRAGKNIWAMGDVAGTPQFTYMSLDDYRIVRDQLFGNSERKKTDRFPFATSVFTAPTLAHIGLTEEQAKKDGRNVVVKKLPANAIPKAKVIKQTDGILKAVVDKDTDMILGATLFCAESHELINLIKIAMDNNIPSSYLKNQIFTHPTMAEALNDLFS